MPFVFFDKYRGKFGKAPPSESQDPEITASALVAREVDLSTNKGGMYWAPINSLTCVSVKTSGGNHAPHHRHTPPLTSPRLALPMSRHPSRHEPLIHKQGVPAYGLKTGAITMITIPHAVATTKPRGKPIEEKLQTFSVTQLRQLYAFYKPNEALLGATKLLLEERARDWLHVIKPVLWKCSSTDRLYPVGYARDTARALLLLPATEILSVIVQTSDEQGSPHLLLLSDEFVIDYRNYLKIAESALRRSSYAVSFGKQYTTHRQVAEEIGITESSFSRHISNF